MTMLPIFSRFSVPHANTYSACYKAIIGVLLFCALVQLSATTAPAQETAKTQTATNRIIEGSSSLEDLAQIWSMGGEAPTRGEIGWVAQGALIPEIEKELRKRKKGEVFKIWTKAGVHIVRKTDTKEDTGFALLMRVFL